MSRHEVISQTERDEYGRIEWSGATWTETSPLLEYILLRVFSVSVLAFLIGVVWACIAQEMNIALLGGTLGAVGAIAMHFLLPGRERGVYFDADGEIETPYGIPYRPFLSEIAGTHASIVSIEARAQHDQPGFEGGWTRLFEVVMVSGGGDLICVSRRLDEAVALKAAAQLSQSLAALRRQSPGAFTTLGGEQ